MNPSVLIGASSVLAPTKTTQLNVNSSTQSSARIVLSGQEFYQAGNTDTDGPSLLCGVNRTGNKQLWIGNSASLTQNTTNPIIRIIPTGTTIDAIATDGNTNLSLTIGNSAVTFMGAGGLKFNNSTASYAPYQLNYYEWASSNTVTTSGCTALSLTIYFTRIGNIAYMTWQDTLWATNSAVGTLTATSIVPVRFRPTTTHTAPYACKNFGTNVLSFVQIATTGTCTFNNGVNGGNFSSGTNAFAIYGNTVSWVIL
jgi:hypothetical protein